MTPETRAWIIKELGKFDTRSIMTDLGTLAHRAAKYTINYGKQTEVWQSELAQLAQLGQTLFLRWPASERWPVLMEYEIPRRQKRPDVILIAHNIIFVIEFKFGAIEFHAPDRWQVENYSLDLRDFHADGGARPIIPVLVATEAKLEKTRLERAKGNVFTVWRTQLAVPRNLSEAIQLGYDTSNRPDEPAIDALVWDGSDYKPSLNIIQAAQKLFSQHGVRDIKHAHSTNLDQTTNALVNAIKRARDEKLRLICFVTGVPGAGKTLTGLNAVHSPELRTESKSCGMFLSGNGPLIKIVTAALVSDLKHKKLEIGKREIERQIGSFIRNVHGFINDHPEKRPFENVVVFDEAQRAWSGEKMGREQRGELSEPELMLRIMSRMDWCAIIALVGGGQEIHDGEAGLEEWGRALRTSEAKWTVFASREALSGGEGVAGHRLFDAERPANCIVNEDSSLHLAVSERSYRAQVIATWVNRLLEGDAKGARELLSTAGEFPLVMTRDLESARKWLRARAGRNLVNGRVVFDRRCGLVASSENARIRAYGLEVSSGFRKAYSYVKWFLEDGANVLSSCQLEVPATEFECQGLELDWIGVCWGDDLIPDSAKPGWKPRRLYRSKWCDVRNPAKIQYRINKYRVLLTRAREGMVIWVPPGGEHDQTRPVETMNAVADFLASAGVGELVL
jgi:hypothetical protein